MSRRSTISFIGERGEGYPSDLKDAEWVRLGPLIPEASRDGRPRKTDMRAAMKAILLRTDCLWRYLRRDSFRSRSTVYNLSHVPL